MFKKINAFVLIIIIAIIIISSFFWGWYLWPKRPLDVVMLDKTVYLKNNKETSKLEVDYREHKGFFWMLRQQRFANPLDNDFYDYEIDYYGTNFDKDNKKFKNDLTKLDRVPDIVYLSDTYGDGGISEANVEENRNTDSGVSIEELAVASQCHLNGSMLIGEFNIASAPTSAVVRNELASIFGVDWSGWRGRYIVDMADWSDIPEWVFTLYQQEYGKNWDLKGPGMILVSDKEELLVMQDGVDFNGAPVGVKILKNYQKKYGKLGVNYYYWFEFTKPRYGSEIVANFNFNLTKTGEAAFSKLELDTVIPAIVLNKQDGKTSYYFAGDFNDNPAEDKYSDYFYSDLFHRIFSFDRLGNPENFYWNFYVPLSKIIAKEAYKESSNITKTIPKKESSAARLSGNKVEVKNGETWKEIQLKGFSINGILPGSDPYKYTQDINIYRDWLNSISEMGGNMVRAYDLMPPAFYRAIDEYNSENIDKKIYFYQSIVIPDNIKISRINDAATEAINKNIEGTLTAIYGGGEVPNMGSRSGGVYINDVSSYLLGYIVEADVSPAGVTNININNVGYTFTGEYFSANSTPFEAFVAGVCDFTAKTEQEKYKAAHPIGAQGNALLVPNALWSGMAGGVSLDVSRINVGSNFTAGFFTSYALMPADKAFINNAAAFSNYSDSEGKLPYGGYISTFKKLQTKYPILIDKFGLPTNMNSSINIGMLQGLSEYDQGAGIVRMLRAINKEGYLGGIIYEFTDNWLRAGETVQDFIIPIERNTLWHNALDPEQNYGIMAVESQKSEEIGLSMRDNSGVVDEVQISQDETYIYFTMFFKKDIDYATEQLQLGFDTYERNLGEYLYAPKLFATSLSGMEYIVRFDGKDSASLYVVPNYNVNKFKFASTVGYNGNYELVSKLKYGTFETSNSNFYKSGTAIFLRLPWGSLNFADPSKKMVINDTRPLEEINRDPLGLRTLYTSGIISYILVSEKATNDTAYLFPANKTSNGYKIFSWENWEKPNYRMRLKEGYNSISRYFKETVK